MRIASFLLDLFERYAVLVSAEYMMLLTIELMIVFSIPASRPYL